MRKNLLRMIGVALVGSMGVSCSTRYDAYGKRHQSVSPGGAVVGAVALGALAYSIGRSDGKRVENRRHTRFETQKNYQGYKNSGRRGYSSHGTGASHGSYGGDYDGVYRR